MGALGAAHHIALLSSHRRAVEEAGPPQLAIPEDMPEPHLDEPAREPLAPLLVGHLQVAQVEGTKLPPSHGEGPGHAHDGADDTLSAQSEEEVGLTEAREERVVLRTVVDEEVIRPVGDGVADGLLQPAELRHIGRERAHVGAHEADTAHREATRVPHSNRS